MCKMTQILSNQPYRKHNQNSESNLLLHRRVGAYGCGCFYKLEGDDLQRERLSQDWFPLTTVSDLCESPVIERGHPGVECVVVYCCTSFC